MVQLRPQRPGRHRGSRPHIRRTPRTHPDLPRKFDKDIPGNIWNGEWKPLHRNYPKFDAASEDVTKRNKAANDRACAGLTHDPGEQCDEFPFASTKEGAGKGDGSFSVRYVRQTDNSTAGARLSIWYGKDRILDGDAYGMLVR